MVPRRQVRHLHPLGRSTPCRPSATSGTRATCTSRARPSSRTTSRPTARSRSSATRTSSRSSRRSSFDADGVGAPVQGRRARSSSCRWPSTTTASRCTTAASPSGRAAKMGPKRDIIGELAARGAGRGAGLRPLLPPRRALVVLRRRHGVRLRRAGPALRRLLRPRAAAEEGRGQERAARRRSSSTTGSPAPASSWTSTSRSSSGSTGGSSSRPSRPTCSASPPTTTTAAPSGARASRSTTRTRPSPRRRRSSTSSAASCPASGPMFWQTDTSVSKNSWGYVAKQDYKTAGAIVGDLVDIVSKNGALLLNIGPRPDGTIPEPEQEILREIGRWLTVNGEAIYGTRPWDVYGEGPTAGRGRQLQRHQAPGVHRRRTSASRRSRAPFTRSRSRGRGRRSP